MAVVVVYRRCILNAVRPQMFYVLLCNCSGCLAH